MLIQTHRVYSQWKVERLPFYDPPVGRELKRSVSVLQAEKKSILLFIWGFFLLWMKEWRVERESRPVAVIRQNPLQQISSTFFSIIRIYDVLDSLKSWLPPRYVPWRLKHRHLRWFKLRNFSSSADGWNKPNKPRSCCAVKLRHQSDVTIRKIRL